MNKWSNVLEKALRCRRWRIPTLGSGSFVAELSVTVLSNTSPTGGTNGVSLSL